jgi:hypothetical protein
MTPERRMEIRIDLINSKLKKQGLALRLPVSKAARERHGVCLYRIPKIAGNPPALLAANIDLDTYERLASAPSPRAWSDSDV